MTTDILLGIDVGTTVCKAESVSVDGGELAVGQQPTPWRYCDSGAEIEPLELADTAIAAASEALEATAASADGPLRVRGVGVTSMAETGALVDDAGQPVAPGIAWFDNRGDEQADAIDRDLGTAAFSRHTGLPVSRMCSLAKLAWMRDHWGVLEPGVRWRGVAELVVDRLGGQAAAELSLASRTGLLDALGRSWWPDARSWLGADDKLLADLVPAGTPMGTVDEARLPGAAGAVLTVAGHDHLCSQVGVGALRGDDLLNSCGTAEAFVRAVEPDTERPLTSEAVAAGLTCGWHVLPGRWALLGGLRSGVGLGRVRAMLGVDPTDTARLDEAALAVPDGADGMVLHDLGRDRMTLEGIGAQPTPGHVWRAAIESAAARGTRLEAAFERLAGPTGRLLATGGWVRSRAVAEIKRQHLGDFVAPDVRESGARGAALIGGVAAGVYPSPADVPAPADAAR